MTTTTPWIEITGPLRSEDEQDVYSAAYTLREIAEEEGITSKAWSGFQKTTRLSDLYWRTYWNASPTVEVISAEEVQGEDEPVPAFPSEYKMVVVLLHGWDGIGDIWENLPAKLCQDDPTLLVLVPDVNGFGRTPFTDPEHLDYSDCDPIANMRAVEKWLQVIGICGSAANLPVVLVGHSMSGASLFYLNTRSWQGQEVGRMAMAPALLMNDLLRKGFFRTLGLGIWAGKRLQQEKLVNKLAPFITNVLIPGASKAVQATHKRAFNMTAKETLATAFFAMGSGELPKPSSRWGEFRVILAHNDRLVGVSSMLNLLEELGFRSGQVQVFLGDHYFFSVGQKSKKFHTENRDLTFAAIKELIAATRPAPAALLDEPQEENSDNS